MSIFTNKRRKGKEPGMTKNEKRTKEKENKENKEKQKTKHRETCTNLEQLNLVTQMSRMRSEIPLTIFYSVLNSIFNIQCPDLHYDIPQMKPTFL